MDTHELAWAAGFFDGEGHIYAPGLNNGSVVFSVAQVDRAVLDRMQRALGGIGKVLGPYKRKTRPIWQFNVANFEHSQYAVAMLWNWLSPVKREQAKQAISKYLNLPRKRAFRKPLVKEISDGGY